MSDKIISYYRKRLTREKGTTIKDWGGKTAIALAYPNHYRVGMSSLGFQVIYKLFNRRDDVVAERVFLPDRKERDLYGEKGKGLLSIESQSMLRRFDIVAFSLSFENDYLNILKMLELGKIPLKAEERGPEFPLIMAGGINTFLNPEPISSFFDLFLLGEADEILDDFVDQYNDAMQAGVTGKELLREVVQNLKSAYVPSFYKVKYNEDGTIRSRVSVDGSIPEKIEVARLESGGLQVNTSAILTPETEFDNKTLIELGRGCGRSCRFCAAGYVYRPPRFQNKSELLSFLDKTDCHRVGLLSASVLDIPGIGDAMDLITGKNGSFSVSSLRADLLTIEILDRIRKTGQKSLAIAPEAGSERMRKVINKHLTLEQINSAARMIAKTGDFTLRLYFLMGLPSETWDDVAEIMELGKSIKHKMVKESKDRGRIGTISLSVNCFIPKAFTPFQWFQMEDLSLLKEKQKWLKKAVSREGGVKVSFDIPKWAYLQTLLSMGDRRVGSLLLLAHEFNGDWSKAYRYSELNPDYFVYRPRKLNEILPWDFIDNCIHKGFLKKEYKLALKGKESEICSPGDCERCGVCGPKE